MLHTDNHSKTSGIPSAWLQNKDVFVFDLDNTLYPAGSNMFAQVDRNIGAYVQSFLGLSADEARKVQKRYLVEHGTTLSGLMAHHTIDPQHYLDAVHDIDFTPISYDSALRAQLQSLPGRKIVFTNADTPYAEKVLERIGIHDQFEGIFDIRAAGFKPKPTPEIYDQFLSRFGVAPEKAIMFEDMARNLLPAHDRGMGTVWINTGEPWGKADHHPHYIENESTLLSEWLKSYFDARALSQS